MFEKEEDRNSLLPAAAPRVADLLDLVGGRDESSNVDALNKSSLKEYLRPIIAQERLLVFVSLTVTFGIHLA